MRRQQKLTIKFRLYIAIFHSRIKVSNHRLKHKSSVEFSSPFFFLEFSVCNESLVIACTPSGRQNDQAPKSARDGTIQPKKFFGSMRIDIFRALLPVVHTFAPRGSNEEAHYYKREIKYISVKYYKRESYSRVESVKHTEEWLVDGSDLGAKLFLVASVDPKKY